MSRSMNMLRTRRRDNNVKPNRRLDRKSSRGMLYENEELRLKTININAEIERGQSDIKKLKRENEMLKKEIWCLRDEYDKLDKMLKDKKIDFSSSSTTCSSSSSGEESCSSCTEESEEVETSQNLQNVQKTNLKNLRDQFDHLSVVTEETSCENSDRNSRHSLQQETQDNLMWNYNQKDIIKPDQSYPVFQNLGVTKSQTLPNQMHQNFFCPIQTSKSYDDNNFPRADDTYKVDMMYPNPPVQCSTNILVENENIPQDDFINSDIGRNSNSFYQNMVLVPTHSQIPELKSMEKKASDLIVKIDNQNFNNSLTYSNTTPTTTFSNNGAMLDELLNDIESLSQRGVNQCNQNQQLSVDYFPDVQNRDLTYSDNPVMDNLISEKNVKSVDDKTHKSELSVVLMPKAMPLIGFEKYRQMQRSFESLHSRNLEDMSASQQNLAIIPPTEDTTGSRSSMQNIPQVVVQGIPQGPETNPFFFGNLKDNYVSADYFGMRYDAKNALNEEDTKKNEEVSKNTGSKTNLLELTSNSEQISSENEENLKFALGKNENDKEKSTRKDSVVPKTPKLSIRRKVSIHFKGKKEREKEKEKEKEKQKRLAESSTPEVKLNKKHSMFDIRFSGDTKDNEKVKNIEKQGKSSTSHQKTPSIESKKSTTETSNFDPKTPTSSDSKTNSDKKTDLKKDGDKIKIRKSSSVSPDRNKHVHVKDDGSPKKHKKHKRAERSGRTRRASEVPRMYRERSNSACTDRSNIIDSRLGYGFGGFMYDDYSERERTNSLSSCDTGIEQRKMSTMSGVPLNGKVPWCGCWGNGCL